MAKQINIQFNAQPITTGVGFLYTIQVSGFNIYYSNGFNECKINFIANGATPTTAYQVPIGLTLDDTLQATLSFLRDNYINELIDYNLNGNVIEVLIQADATINIDAGLNASLEISTEDVEPSGDNLIYYLYFDDYVLNFYKKNYLGSSSEVFGSFSLKKSAVDSILSPIRGTGLEISLEANQTLTFDEFLLTDEFTYKTELLKGSQTIFKGYIKPDGVQQSFVNSEWLINITTTDGLGALKDLSFVQENGLSYLGMMSFYEVIKACLDRTKLAMDINTSITVEYVGYTGDNILKEVFINSTRFIKDKDDNVLMDCNEVLTSVLNLFSGIITQQDGNWYVLRPNDLANNGYTSFINQTDDIVFTKNLNAVLGSQVNNFYPHHCDSNQQIEVKGAISAYRLNYQYGFLDGYVKNTSLKHDEEMVFEDWETNPALPIYVPEPDFPFDPMLVFEIINDPLSTSGLEMWTREEVPFITEVLTSTVFGALENQVLTFRMKGSTKNIIHQFIFQIKTSDGYYLSKYNGWVLDSDAFIKVQCGTISPTEFFITHELLMPPVPNNCDIKIVICAPKVFPLYYPSPFGISKITYIQILDNEIQKSGIVGEFHTVSRKNPPSSITKENQKVFNGDGERILIGSIYKDDLETLTNLWSRKDKFETLPLLGISAMDDLRIQSSPIQLFSGSIYGEIPYLSVINIDNVVGSFMFIEYEYDYKSKITQSKMLQFYNADLGDIEYEVSPDYGKSTIKPTIKG
jgi:hypothetical protein